MPQQDMCPICVKPFKDGDIVMQYRVWGDEKQSLAHVRCVIILATPAEKPSKRK
jgi:hypothetical protein